MKNRDIGYLIKAVNDKLKAKGDAHLKKHHLTFSQIRVLAFLNNCGGQATQKEIEAFLNVSHPTVVGIVTRMEQNGHVISWKDAKDRRNKIVQMTDQSISISRDIENRVRADEQIMLQSLSQEDIQTFIRCLNTVYDNLEQYEPE